MNPEHNLLSLITEMRQDQLRIVEKLLHIEARLDTFQAAFPGQDIDGHRRYHEGVIEWLEMRNRIVRECLLNAAKVGTLGSIGWMMYAIWAAIKMEFHK